MDKRIILLNGPSSSGKSTLAGEIRKMIKEQRGLDYAVISIDDHMRISEDETIYEDDVWEISGEMCDAVREALRTSDGAIVDHVITSERIYEQFLQLQETAPVLKVRVTCPLSILLVREERRGNRAHGSARDSYDYLYPKEGYDVTVDTSVMSPQDCAASVISSMDPEEQGRETK
ncbi:MAG: AAA family ATPase [Oscillospiraceae bacterium]|nr:AAA family ATPase [Oscillospiraceae bacterium]MBQ5342147.1 AAA family ATPase [Oscillospiraceae bacterium]